MPGLEVSSYVDESDVVFEPIFEGVGESLLYKLRCIMLS
jgi:hypothetical protein